MGDRNQVPSGRTSWGKALLFGLPVAIFILMLFGYWFAYADRYTVFLYYHDMGPRVPDTAPFSRVTASRYWMAGLVASGAVMLLYVGVNWLLGRLSNSFHAPMWWRVWVVAALPLVVVVPAITMLANEPVLPWSLALQVVLAMLAGLALALLPGDLAARNPSRLLWLAADGWGLALLLLTLPQLEDIRIWLSMDSRWSLVLSLVLVLAGLIWLVLLSFVRAWLGLNVENYPTLLLAGCSVAYLLLPLLHHTLGTDGYFYLTDSDNFFASALAAQLLGWLIVALLTYAVMRLRLILRAH